MKILLLDQFSEPGGAQLCLRDLAVEMVRRGWNGTFVAPGDGGMRRELEEIGFRVMTIPGFHYTNGYKTFRDVSRYGFDLARAIAALRGIAKTERPDVVYINGPRVLPMGFVFRCPIVFHAHSHLCKKYSRAIAAACIRTRGVQVLAASKFAGGAFEGWIGTRHTHVIYSGVADMGFAVRARRGPVRIGILGRIAPEKGQLDFVRAARLLPECRSDVEFVVHGSAIFSQAGYEQQVRREADGLPVRFAGWTTDVGRTLHEIDILAVPSNAIEAAGRVVMEAFSAGTPVVAYRSGGIPELIEHERTGLLTETATPESLAQNLERLIAAPALAQRIAREGREAWERRFRVERFQREVCDLLGEIHGKPEERREMEPALAVTRENHFV